MESSENGNQGKPKEGKKKRKTGTRCIVYGCGNTIYQGFAMHQMPGKMPLGQERFDSIQKQWIAFIGRKRKFDFKDAKQYARIFVCSGHFLLEDYEPTQVEMYRRGLRTRPPSLKAGSSPSLDIAVQPFPSDWFLPSPSSLLSLASSPPSGTSTADSPHSEFASASCSVPPTPAVNAPPSTDFQSPSLLAHGPDKPKRSRKESIYIRKREADALFIEYARQAEEEQAQDILDRSKGEQCGVRTADRKVGIRVQKRSCKVHVKPKTMSKGTQVNMTQKTHSQHPVGLQISDAGTQTETTNTQDKDEDMMDEEPDEDPDFEIGSDSDEKKDPTYKPGKSRRNRSSSDEETYKVTKSDDVLKEEKYIVFESNLFALFNNCFSCLSSDVQVEKICPRSFGSQIKIRQTCLKCSKIKEWHSQPKVGNVSAGNLLLSAAILYGGASPTKVLRVLQHMNLKAITNNTFLEYQSTYLQPAIMRVYEREQRSLLRQSRGEKLVLGGDGRADSPGHSAKYGSYALMDMKRKKIINVELVQSNEVSSSNAMEKEGLARGLAKLYGMGVEVGTLITDRHASVAKWLRETYPEIDHRYDVWHIAKGVRKKITAVSKLKDCEVAHMWKQSMITHIYWSAASTPDGDGNIMVSKYKSVFNHMRDVHAHEGVYPKCGHGDDYPPREWMREGTKVYEKLSEELLKTRLLNDMKKMSPLAQTSSVESFHSVLLYWCPKMLAYSYAGMKCRLYLAALHWNENSDRSQATKSDGSPMFRVTYQKAKEGRQTVSKVLTACTFEYVNALMVETVRLVSGKQKLRSEMEELQNKPPLSSKYERPDREEAIQKAAAHHRFAME
ncbi:uncharacterized protein LOC129268390 [Lytechinus pictus]|uniref:uncharacterized protein LOC129268390 n=1 Tax=Lytechinus pictus TaxID=7653 RepID=UPI0030B9DAF3